MLERVVQRRRDTRAALKLLKQLLCSQPAEPESIVTGRLASYGSALRALGRERAMVPVACASNHAENAHLPIRQRKREIFGLKSREPAQRFLTPHAAICNAFGLQRHIISQPTLRVFCAQAALVCTRAVA